MKSKVPWWIRQVPNALSGLRLCLAVAFPFLPPRWRLSAVLASGATDWLDGRIARRYGVQSTLGGLLDAVADKAFVLSVLVTFTLAGTIEAWQVPAVLVRDLAVLYTVVFFAVRREWAAFEGMPARRWGKITTMLLFTWFVVLLVPALASLRNPVFFLVVFASVVAGADYLRRFAGARSRRMGPGTEG